MMLKAAARRFLRLAIGVLPVVFQISALDV